MTTEIGAFSDLVEAATALANLDSPTTSAKAEDASMAEGNDVQEGAIEKNCASSGENDAALRNKREIFPQRLMAVLNDASLSDIVSWLPHGRSFVIIRPDVFTEKVMPTYFPPVDARASTKYPSFTRKLNRWGFRQATRGPDTGAFHHPLFRRDRPELCVDMVCQRSRGAPAKANKKQQQRNEDKLKVAPLTKESIEKILPSPTATFEQTAAAVSVDETRSTTSNHSNNSAATSALTVLPCVIKQGISSDKAFVELTIRQRDEMERMRVAQSMLYKAFTSALQGRTD